jgi:hypothetical protein
MVDLAADGDADDSGVAAAETLHDGDPARERLADGAAGLLRGTGRGG